MREFKRGWSGVGGEKQRETELYSSMQKTSLKPVKPKEMGVS